MQEQDLKKVTFLGAADESRKPATHLQTLLLKALSEGVTDVKDLVKMTGAKNAAEVYRTFDKLSIRKEYHMALARAGITLDSLVLGIKEIWENGDKDSTRLKALAMLLKSIGLDKYETQEGDGKDWETELLRLADKKDKGLVEELPSGDYSVNVPTPPAEESASRLLEKNMAKELYGGN